KILDNLYGIATSLLDLGYIRSELHVIGVYVLHRKIHLFLRFNRCPGMRMERTDQALIRNHFSVFIHGFDNILLVLFIIIPPSTTAGIKLNHFTIILFQKLAPANKLLNFILSFSRV